MESEARRQANAALTRIILKSVAEGEKKYPQFQTHWTRHRRTMETTPMSQWTSKLSDEKLMRMLSNPEKIFDRWLTLSGLSSGKPGNVKTKFDEALLAKNRQSYAEEIHHILELYEQEGLVPKGASRQWYAKFNETKEFLEFGGGSSPDSTAGLVKGEHVGSANPDKKGPLTISQLASAHGGSTTESAGEGFFSPEERPELRAVEQQFDTDRRRAGLTHLIDNPNSLTNRLRDATQQVADEHQKLFKDAKGRAKLDKLYPDLNPGTLWEIANTPGTNVLDRPATPEEIATFEAAKGGGIPETQANQAQKQRLTDELGGVGPDGKPAPIQSMYQSLGGKRRAAAAGAIAGLTGVGYLGTAASLAETAVRGDIATTTNDPADYLQFGLSGISAFGDFFGHFGELISTPADAANVFIDEVRNPDRKPATMQSMSEGSQYSMPTDTSVPDPNKIGEELGSLKDGAVQQAKDTWGAVGSLWEKMQKGAEHINLSGYSGL